MKLRAFLYVLLRDHITLGAFEALMRDAKIEEEKGADFSNRHLRDYLDEAMAQLEACTCDREFRSGLSVQQHPPSCPVHFPRKQ